MGFREKYPLILLNFNENQILLKILEKNIQISNLMKFLSVEPSCFMRTGGRTERRTDMRDAFRNFANVPKHENTEAVLVLLLICDPHCLCGICLNYE